jgi:hypothetical protein
MAEWAHIENGEIQGQYDVLPQNWRNVSGLNLSSDNLPFLKSLGWYPVTKQSLDYDSSQYYISGYEYSIREDDVLETPQLTEQDPVDNEALHDTFLNQLRYQRNQKLKDSDWTQLPDVQNLMDEETKTKWLTYRQALRDITQTYSDVSNIDINTVVWPEV